MINPDYTGNIEGRAKTAAMELGYFVRRVGKVPPEIAQDIKSMLDKHRELLTPFLEGALQADLQRQGGQERKG